MVYVDSNNNGVQDPGEVGIQGVTITLTKTDGPVTFSLTTTTAADGSYSFAEVTGMTILPSGTYSLTETPPIYFVDGKDTPGNVPATVSQDQFSGITLAAGQAATGFNFGELGLKAQYVAAFFGRRAFFASSTPQALNLNLAQGAAFFRAWRRHARHVLGHCPEFGPRHHANDALQQRHAGTDHGDHSCRSDANLAELEPEPGGAALLEISGTDPQVNVSTSTQRTASNAVATPVVSWHNSANPLDVNGDGIVTPLDALIVINHLNAQGAGALGSRRWRLTITWTSRAPAF